MAFKSYSPDYIFFPIYYDENEVNYRKRLLRLLMDKSNLTYGDISEKGGGTTFAELQWNYIDTEVKLVAVNVETICLDPNKTSPEEMVDIWVEFTKNAAAEYIAEKLAR